MKKLKNVTLVSISQFIQNHLQILNLKTLALLIMNFYHFVQETNIVFQKHQKIK